MSPANLGGWLSVHQDPAVLESVPLELAEKEKSRGQVPWLRPPHVVDDPRRQLPPRRSLSADSSECDSVGSRRRAMAAIGFQSVTYRGRSNSHRSLIPSAASSRAPDDLDTQEDWMVTGSNHTAIIEPFVVVPPAANEPQAWLAPTVVHADTVTVQDRDDEKDGLEESKDDVLGAVYGEEQFEQHPADHCRSLQPRVAVLDEHDRHHVNHLLLQYLLEPSEDTLSVAELALKKYEEEEMLAKTRNDATVELFSKSREHMDCTGCTIS